MNGAVDDVSRNERVDSVGVKVWVVVSPLQLKAVVT